MQANNEPEELEALRAKIEHPDYDHEAEVARLDGLYEEAKAERIKAEVELERTGGSKAVAAVDAKMAEMATQREEVLAKAKRIAE